MSPDRLGLPSKPRALRESAERVHDTSDRMRSALLLAAMIVGVTVLHAFIEGGVYGDAIHKLLDRAYYIPVVFAAIVFGKRGGVVAAIACAVPYLFHADTLAHGEIVVGFDHWLEVFTLLGVGLLFGALHDMEEARTTALRQVSLELEDAYRKLEEHAMQLINVKDYTTSILRSITSAVITVGPDGSVATANPVAERMLGISEFEMVPKPIGSLFRDDGGVAADVTKVLSGRLPLALRETTLVTSGGKEVHVQASSSRMRAVGGSILGAVVTLEDVSEIKALTEQLIRADRLAAMGELTAGVAHEVRNPLGVIRAGVQLLEDAHGDAERVEAAASIMKQEIDRLDRVIKALLDFGRPSRPTLLEIDLNDVLDDVVLFTQRFAGQSDVTIAASLQPDLDRVFGDPDQLKQVFLNLITNAVQAMEPAGGTIHITTQTTGDYVEVTVADDGPGIEATDLSKIFDPFFTKRAEGTGLGLTIVHRIIDEHDGHIEVDSSPEGTTFRVSLPAVMKE